MKARWVTGTRRPAASIPLQTCFRVITLKWRIFAGWLKSKKRSDKRRRTDRVHVRLTPDESRVVRAHAGNTGLSPVGLMRTLALGHEPVSVIDSAHIIELIRLRGDLGRAGGLLKLWLSKDKAITLQHRREINRLRDTMLANQTELRTAINNIIEASKSSLAPPLALKH